MAKKWKPIEGSDCPYCGSGAEIYAWEGLPASYGSDGDKARCQECHCPGSVIVEEFGGLWVNWHDDPDCRCDWCKEHPQDD